MYASLRLVRVANAALGYCHLAIADAAIGHSPLSARVMGDKEARPCVALIACCERDRRAGSCRLSPVRCPGKASPTWGSTGGGGTVLAACSGVLRSRQHSSAASSAWLYAREGSPQRRLLLGGSACCSLACCLQDDECAALLNSLRLLPPPPPPPLLLLLLVCIFPTVPY